jgi:hypothetical protein
VLADVTKYLLLYKRLCIPHVGTFEVVQQAPEYTVVDKLILPPQFSVRYHQQEQLSEHQLEYLAASVNSSKESAWDQLVHLGHRIRNRAEKKSFYWNGIGALTVNGNTVNFENNFAPVEGLSSVDAHKVLRENVEHSRLVGDKQTSSAVQGRSVKKSWWTLPVKWAWIILAIAVVAILIILILYRFTPLATGLKLKFF